MLRKAIRAEYTPFPRHKRGGTEKRKSAELDLGRAVSLWPLCRDTIVVTEESTDTRAPTNGTVGSLPWLIVASELPCGVTCSPVPW